MVSEEKGKRARNWLSEFRAWGWSWQGNRGARAKANFVLESAPLACGKMQGAARTKLAQRISCAEVLLACMKGGAE